MYETQIYQSLVDDPAPFPIRAIRKDPAACVSFSSIFDCQRAVDRRSFHHFRGGDQNSEALPELPG
jgi:hypothetical protein